MNFIAVAGLVVAVLGLPAVWITWLASRGAIRAAAFDSVYDYVQANQPELRSVAWNTSPSYWKSEKVPMLVPPGWLLNKPRDLDCITLKLVRDDIGTSHNVRRRLDLPANPFSTYDTYSKALMSRSANAEMFNGVVYQPLSVEVTKRGLRITCKKGGYFDYLDSSEVLAYELGARVKKSKRNPAAGPRRRSVTDPFNLMLRSTSLGINTLTIRKDSSGQHGFYMHKRNGHYVVNESGLIHVVPAGEFTPSDISYEALQADFSIWRNIMREYAEEFLGIEESYGRGGRPLDFENDPPYSELSIARKQGELIVRTFGIAIEALCLKPELLTVCIFEGEVFDRIFADMVSEDGEGTLLVGRNSHGISFTQSSIKEYADNKETASAGAACLKLAWRFRKQLGL